MLNFLVILDKIKSEGVIENIWSVHFQEPSLSVRLEVEIIRFADVVIVTFFISILYMGE
jgi:hypothetical protein